MDPRVFRRSFVAGLFKGLRVVWPILSGLLVLIVALGVAAGLLEGWSLQESVYFSFVSGLTIGYGDFAPKTPGRGSSFAGFFFSWIEVGSHREAPGSHRWGWLTAQDWAASFSTQ